MIFSALVFISLTCAPKSQESLIQSSYGHRRTPCLRQTQGILMHHLVNPGCRENSQQGTSRNLLQRELRQKEAYAASSSLQTQALLPGRDSVWVWRDAWGLAMFPQFGLAMPQRVVSDKEPSPLCEKKSKLSAWERAPFQIWKKKNPPCQATEHPDFRQGRATASSPITGIFRYRLCWR